MNVNLGETIDRVRQFGIDVAVLRNASLIDRPDVRADLANAEFVSVKVDAEADVLGVTAAHPMRESGLRDLLDRARGDWSVIDDLLESGELVGREFGGERFSLRPITTVEE